MRSDGTREEQAARTTAAILEHPIIERISELAAIVARSRLVVVFPGEGGWKEVRPRSPLEMPVFCRSVQSTKEGARRCRMCHVLMSVAACAEGLTEQQCHAGARVLVAPAASGASGALAVLSSCVFHDPSSVKAVRARARSLGTSPQEAEDAYRALPSLSPVEKDILRRTLDICAAAVKEIHDNARLAAENRRLADHVASSPLTSTVKARLRNAAPPHAPPLPAGEDSGRPSSLIRILTQLIDESPHLPFTEKELASASRLTPNHLSLLFHRHTGRCFSDYLADRRMGMAKGLLCDLTLSVGEVARKVGYDDPGYFARRFRARTGMTPRQWRESGKR